MAFSKASTSAIVAIGRSAARSVPASSTLHGEERIKPSITAVRIIAERRRSTGNSGFELSIKSPTRVARWRRPHREYPLGR